MTARLMVCYPFLLAFLASPACAHVEVHEVGMIQVAEENSVVTYLVTTEGLKFQLEGEMVDELDHLDSAIVRIKGTARQKHSATRLEVKSYLITDTGMGIVPHVGQLQYRMGAFWLVQGPGQPTIELTGPLLSSMRTHVRAKIWLVGPIVGEERLQVLGYGILSSPSEW